MANNKYITLRNVGGGGSTYTLPAATQSTLGGVKIGSGVTVDSAGTISVAATDLSGYYTSAQTNNAITAATQNMVTSTTISTIWKGTQAEYDTLTNSGSTASSNTFYIIVPSA